MASPPQENFCRHTPPLFGVSLENFDHPFLSNGRRSQLLSFSEIKLGLDLSPGRSASPWHLPFQGKRTTFHSGLISSNFRLGVFTFSLEVHWTRKLNWEVRDLLFSYRSWSLHLGFVACGTTFPFQKCKKCAREPHGSRVIRGKRLSREPLKSGGV